MDVHGVESFRVSYQLTEKDAREAYFRAFNTRSFKFCALLVVVVCIGIVVSTPSDWPFFIVIPALFLAEFMFFRWNLRRAIRRNPALSAERILEIRPSGFSITTGAIEAIFGWDAFDAIGSSSSSYWLHRKEFQLGKGDIQIPRRAFSSAEQEQKFLSIASRAGIGTQRS